ncbi:MAG: hypothetical protein ACREIA_20125 [Opitutaceae bacterium]
MKAGILSESPADEAAVRVIMERLAGVRFEIIQPALRARGWPNVMQVLPAVFHHLQMETDAETLVVVVDSDDTPIHDGEHENPDRFHPLCRICQLEMVIRRARKRIRLPDGRAPLFTAVGMAVPAIEAWYLCGIDPEVGEARWQKCREDDWCPFNRRDLKQRLYGTMRPTLALETTHAVAEAKRLAADLRRLENDFPVGFGNLVRSVRAWKQDRQPGAMAAAGATARSRTHNLDTQINS